MRNFPEPPDPDLSEPDKITHTIKEAYWRQDDYQEAIDIQAYVTDDLLTIQLDGDAQIMLSLKDMLHLLSFMLSEIDRQRT